MWGVLRQSDCVCVCAPCGQPLYLLHPHVLRPSLDFLSFFFGTDSTENIVLQVIAQEPLVEGDNVTLKCVADGNPAPTSFNFHLKVHISPPTTTIHDVFPQ